MGSTYVESAVFRKGLCLSVNTTHVINRWFSTGSDFFLRDISEFPDTFLVAAPGVV